MPLTGALQADFSGFVAESAKASAALGKMEEEAKKAGTTLAKTGTSLDSVEGKTSNFTDTLQSVAGAVGIAFSVEAVIGFGQEILATADTITRLADQTGLTVEQVQRLSYTAGQAGNTLDQITDAASKMQIALNTEKGQKAVEALGFSFRAFAAEKPYDQLLQVSDALRAIPDATKQAQLGAELFGDSFAKILPTLASDMRAVGAAAQVSSDEQIAALDAAGDAIDRWATTAHTAAVGAAGSLLQAGEQVADQGLLKTISLWASSPTTAIFLQNLANIRTAVKDTAEVISEAEILAQGGFGPEPGQTPAERAAAERAAAKAKTEHEQAAKKLTEALADLTEVRKGSFGLLKEMEGATLTAVQLDLKLGASQATVATAYGLSAAHIRAASDALKEQALITTGLGSEWASVGTKVDTTIDHILVKIKKLKDDTKAYEAETLRQMEESWKQIPPPIEAATQETQQMTVAMRDLGGAVASVHQQMQAGMALMDAYREAGVATGMQIATGGYQFSRLKQAGVMPTMGSTGNTLNVNVNSTEANNIAESLVTQMRRQGVRF